MLISIKHTKDFTEQDIVELFHSVEWDIFTDNTVLYKAMQNSSRVITAWHENKLVGLVRSMDDSLWNANIDCLVVHKDYQNRNIGSQLIKTLLEEMTDILCISVSPNDAANIGFYKKFGFKTVEGSSLLQLIK